MYEKAVVSALLMFVLLLVVLAGCSSDDGGTGPVSRKLSDQEAFQQITENFDEIGIGAIGAAIIQTTTNWGGYVEPDIDGFIDGFGKISSQYDTVWYEYRNGWHIFFADSTAGGRHGGDDWTFEFVVCDSVQFRVWDAILPFPEDPTYLDERAHIGIDFALANDTSFMELGVLAYFKAVLELVSDDYLSLNLDQRFEFTVSAGGSGHATSIVTFSHSVESGNLLFSPDDGYRCPVSGEVHIVVSISVTDSSGTATGSGVVDVVISNGDAAVTITVGAYSDTYVYEDICDGIWMSPSFGTLLDSVVK